MEANQLITNVEVFSGNLPDLNKADAAPLELNGEYWTPEKPGEKRRMFFKELRTETTVDQQTGKDIELLVAYFVEVVDGRKKVDCGFRKFFGQNQTGNGFRDYLSG